MVILIIAWLACASWCASLAEKQGKNKTNAFFAGLCFGIFAVGHYAGAARKAEIPGTFRDCTKCGTRRFVRHQFWTCPTCHRSHRVTV